jgi:Putative Flp pilus-assembly TadE/G-like
MNQMTSPATESTSPNPRKAESGVTLPLVALMMVTLLGIASFAVDLGWFYLNASRIQRAADAAALAGVIHMPNALGTASNVAHDIAQTNGYEDLEIPGTYPTVEATGVALQPTQLRVTVTDEVPTFFLKVFGMSSQVITRTAQAEFVPPLPMGSPFNQFGNSCDPELSSGCGDNFWANIHGRYTDTVMGDAFSSACRGDNQFPCSTANATFRDDADSRPGYLYGIEAAGNSSFQVQFTDVVFRNISGGQTTSDQIRTGDRGCEAWGTSAANCGQIVRVALYPPDTTPLDVTDGTAICTQDIAPQPQIPETDPYIWVSPSSCFTVNNPGAGIYVLQVRVLSSGSDPDGLNRYSVRSMPASTRLYALGDMSIYNNASGTTTEFHLAEVLPIYKGKTFVVELYDAGESDAPGTLQVIAPGGAVFTGTCRIYDRTLTTDPWILQSTPVSCQETVNPGEYNGRWLKFEMVLPSTYACTDCWWKMNYVYTSGLQDTTTWRAYIEGNPIHLVPAT